MIRGGVGQAVAHDSAALHVSGRALYTDDLAEPRGMLHAALGTSPHAHARVLAMDLAPVRAAPGIVDVITAADIPGVNDYGPVVADDPILAPGLVEYVGHALFAVAGVSFDAARRGVRQARIDYAVLEPVLDLDTAVERGSFVLPSQSLCRGEPQAAIAAAPRRLRGRVRCGGQDQFYLEGQIAMAVPGERETMQIYSSTQYPAEVQHLVARALGLQDKDVSVECRRMGGAFGGKESQPALLACVAAVLARRSGRAVKLRLDRDEDMIITGKRHDDVIDYEVGFDERGRIAGLALTYASRCGMSADLSGAVNDRTMFHSDNCYYLENVAITSHRCKTNTVSNTAFRGFGGPQGMFAIEFVIDEIARSLGLEPLAVRRANFYGQESRNVTPYGQVVEDNIIERVIDELVESSAYAARRQAVEAFNRDNRILRRGLALTPVKFGISFTATHLNQAGALLHVYSDGSVHLNHGGTEMGQGLYTKVAQVVAEELQIDIEQIRLLPADTAKIPNASATAASSGSDLNGKAAQAAAMKIRNRLTEFAAAHFGVAESEVRFAANQVLAGEHCLSFAELARLAYLARVSLSATGFYRTPRIHYDRETLTGRPFFYYAYGAAVAEVAVDSLTGEYRVRRLDLLHDCGQSLNPALDLGQIEGGFVQGMGWLTSEELYWDAQGVLQTHAPSTYKIPVSSDIPADFRVSLLTPAGNREDTIYRSKAVGEPPLMLALSVFHALKDAVASFARPGESPRLDAPATPEAVLLAIEELKSRTSPAQVSA